MDSTSSASSRSGSASHAGSSVTGQATMKAAVYEQYGGPEVLQLREVTKPVPKDNEVLIRISTTTVTSADHRARSLELPAGFGMMGRLVFGVSKPRQPILGAELAGVVEAVGSRVTRFKVGDPVFGFCDAAMGCYAQYRCLPEDGKLALKPEALTLAESAALSFGGVTALYFLKAGKVAKGERVLVVGASGAVGSACVQLARHLGAEVTGVCSAANLDLVRSLGAAHVIDYGREDFTQNGQTYDVIIDTIGTAPFPKCQGSLTETGRLLVVSGTLYDWFRLVWVAMTSRKKLIAGVALGSPADLKTLADLAESGAYRPLIDRQFSLDQIVDAHRYVDTGRKKGTVLIQVN